ncbi:CutC-like protein [Phycisphaerae bacterium RAS1]|nr:CutC-like protein [Phycisphaerae bacterium RAS1]
MRKLCYALADVRTLLEVTVDSVADAFAAVAAGADRIEFCAQLETEGLTPSMADVASLRRGLAVPLMVMIRPRVGAYCYTPAELRQIGREIDAALGAGADGVVIGAAGPDGCIDVDGCRSLTDRCRGREAVFHRAMDDVPDPSAALEQLIRLGFRRVLTSGRPGSVAPPSAGAEVVRALVRQAAGRIEILPAGGIRADNVGRVLDFTGCGQVHSSCRARPLPPGAGVDATAVRALRAAIDGHCGGRGLSE